MDFTLTKELQMLRKMYRDFAENEVKPLAQEIDEEERSNNHIFLSSSPPLSVSYEILNMREKF